MRGTRRLLTSISALCVAAAAIASVAHPPHAAATEPAAAVDTAAYDELFVYVGTYTSDKSQGIYRFRLDLRSGRAGDAVLAAETANPSFLALHPRRPLLYAVGEISDFDGKKSGAVAAFTRDPSTGDLELIDRQPSGGEGPCHLVVDHTGRCVLVANYGGGSVAALPIRADGGLDPPASVVQHEGSSVNPQRQQGPHAHSINVDAANRFAFAADLGLDKILVYRLDATHAMLRPNEPPSAAVDPGSGPRHFAFHPSGGFAYVINELASTVTAFAYDARRGTLTPIQTITTLPADFEAENWTAEVQVHPSGKFLYGSNRGHDSIAAFAIDPSTGKLSPIEREPAGGQTPRNFGIDPTGTYLLAANQESDTINIFRIDPQRGSLEPTGELVNVPAPVCVKMIPVGG